MVWSGGAISAVALALRVPRLPRLEDVSISTPGLHRPWRASVSAIAFHLARWVSAIRRRAVALCRVLGAVVRHSETWVCPDGTIAIHVAAISMSSVAGAMMLCTAPASHCRYLPRSAFDRLQNNAERGGAGHDPKRSSPRRTRCDATIPSSADARAGTLSQREGDANEAAEVVQRRDHCTSAD